MMERPKVKLSDIIEVINKFSKHFTAGIFAVQANEYVELAKAIKAKIERQDKNKT